MLKNCVARPVRFDPPRAISLVLLATLLLGACSREDSRGEQAAVTVNMEATAVNALIYLAQELRYFADHGLKVVIDDSYPSGAAATDRMLAGEGNISTTAELAIVRYAFAGQKVRTLGSIDMFVHMKLVGRKDLGVTTVSDLVGKKIGVPVNTAADFKLGRFLDLHGIDRKAVAIVDVQAPQAVEALSRGDVDALVTWQPNVMALADLLGDNAAVLEVQSGQPMYCVLMASEDWASRYPEERNRFLAALLQAEEYLIRNGDRAREIVRTRLGYDHRYIDTIWSEHQFSLRLDQSLILAMEDQARWLLENGLATAEKVPDFLEYLQTDGLLAVKPRAVSIIR